MSKQTVTGSILDGLNRNSGEPESSGQEFLAVLPPSAKALEAFPIDQIFLGTNVRKAYTNLEELAESIKQNGLLEPIGLERDPDPKNGKRKLVYGHRRFKAISEILKWKTVKAVLVDSKQTESEEQRSIVQLIENIQREDIPDSDLAISLKEIKTRLNLTNAELAKRFSKSESWIKAKMDHSNLIGQGLSTDLPTSFLNETRGLPDSHRIKILKSAVNEGWTQKQIREAVTKAKNAKENKSSQNQNSKATRKKEVKAGKERENAYKTILEALKAIPKADLKQRAIAELKKHW